ncbi:MAG: phenylacetate-CoA oxygenase subunit PaaC [Pseudomonadales bacterium]|nr:phenylacetate-CoA oxygenase subunit PaaC [Pseudomonadales bacterium]
MSVDPKDIAEYALRLGDDALILSQRLGEWCADAPTLEEDIALSNVALDYLGRARMLLQHAGSLLDKSEDELAFFRDGPQFKNLLLVELPRGDFAFTMVRQYLLDEYELLYFSALSESGDETIAAIAAKTIKEVRFHQRRSREWMRRLGLGTAESNKRAQVALASTWGYVAEFFAMDEVEGRLLSSGVAVDRGLLEGEWRTSVSGLLSQVELTQPSDDWRQVGGRQGIHTEHLGHMLGEMQIVQRTYPGLDW